MRKRRRPVQWVAGSAYGGGAPTVVTTGGPPVVWEICGSVLVAASTDPIQITRFRVERILGEICMCIQKPAIVGPSSGDVYAIALGVMAADGEDTSSPGVSADSPAPWMWLCHFWAGPEIYNATLSHEYANMSCVRIPVDIKTKRVIKTGEAVQLKVQVANIQAAVSDNWLCTPYLRALVGRAV